MLLPVVNYNINTAFPYINSSSLAGVVTYVGTGAPQSITGLGFQPDLCMIHAINAASATMTIIDSVRGGTKLFTLATSSLAESTDANAISSFDSDGFSVGSSSTINASGVVYIVECFKKNASFFDIVTYTGNATNRTISHSLNGAPTMMWVKNLTDTANVPAYHSGTSATPQNDFFSLNVATAVASDSTYWNNTAPTSSNFAVGTNNETNGNTKSMIAYLFQPTSYFKTFSYTGTSVSGLAVNVGICPHQTWLKRCGTANSMKSINRGFMVKDVGSTQQSPMVLNGTTAFPSNANVSVDLSSTGFTLQTTDSSYNSSASGGLYVGWSYQVPKSHGLYYGGTAVSGTFATPTGVTSLRCVSVWSAGGAGGSTNGSTGGGGGGAGALAETTSISTTAGTTYSFALGAAGSPSSFGALSCTAGSDGAAGASGGTGGNGGTASGGGTNTNGSTGSNGGVANGGNGATGPTSALFATAANWTGAGGAGGTTAQGATGIARGGGGGGDGITGSGAGGNAGAGAIVAYW